MYRADVDLSEGLTQFGQLELYFEFRKDNPKDPLVDLPPRYYRRPSGDEFIVWGPISDSANESITGRSTRAYQAYDKTNGRVYFLNDTWRAEGLEPESAILGLLKAKGVRNAPSFRCGGDLPLPLHATPTDRYVP